MKLVYFHVLRLKVTINKVTTKNLCFSNFGRFVTGDRFVNLQTVNNLNLFFSNILWFLQLLSHSKAGSKFIPFYTKFWVLKIKLLASRCTKLLVSNQEQTKKQNYQDFFKIFKPKGWF